MSRGRRENLVRVGDRVRVRFGLVCPLAEVTEDRGDLGVGGRRIVRVRLLEGELDEPHREFEVPVDEVVPAPR